MREPTNSTERAGFDQRAHRCQLLVEGALRRQVQQNIQRLKDIRCYRGERAPARPAGAWQRTKSNARTRKGKKKTVAGKKGVKAKG